jgi:spore germination protein YaaH
MRFFYVLALVVAGIDASAQAPEIVVYVHGSGESVADSLVRYEGIIDIIAPQTFGVRADGVVHGAVDRAFLRSADRAGMRVMPLIHNPGFNQESIHGLLDDPAARAVAIDSMVAIGLRDRFWGWQFDFENFHVSHRDAMTRFYGEAAAALHAEGMMLSIAVVPTDGSIGESAFARYMQENWRGSFDVAALDSLGDFISLMTYAQHGAATAPGPIAGLPWMRRMLDFALAEGVAPSRLSFGLPFYSGYWEAGHRESTGPRPFGREVPRGFVQERLEGEPLWLEEQGVSMAFREEEGTFQWLFIEDARSMAAKLELTAEYPPFRGLSIWVLGAEDPGVWALLRAWKTWMSTNFPY